MGHAILYDQTAIGWTELGARRRQRAGTGGKCVLVRSCVLGNRVVAVNAGWNSGIGKWDATLSLGKKEVASASHGRPMRDLH